MEGKKLYRSRNRMIAGVCAGVADYFGMDVSLVRIIFALMVLAGTVGAWVYLLMWLVVPEA